MYFELWHRLEIHGFGSHFLRLNDVDSLLEGCQTLNFSNSENGRAGVSVSLRWELKRWLFTIKSSKMRLNHSRMSIITEEMA